MEYLRFTRNVGKLTRAQRVFYETNGYLIIKRFMPQNILDRCSNRFDDIASGKVPSHMMTVMKDVSDRKTVVKIQDILHDEVLTDYVDNQLLLDYVASFTGPNIVATHTMLIAKPPDVGTKSSRHPAHQDMYYFPFRPVDRIVAAWTAIEPCDEENGCLFASPGSHVPGVLHPHDYPHDSTSKTINKLYHGIQGLPESMNFVSLVMEPGDTVFFHPLLVHGSGVNRSTRTRKAISCHYAAAECNYVDVRGTVQETAHNEVMKMMKKRYPDIDSTYEDFWRAKSKLVRGIRASL